MTTLTEVQLTGGIYDGGMAHVALDEDGLPPTLYTTDRIGEINLAADQFTGPIAPVITAFFELRNAGTEDHPRWFYQFIGEQTDDMGGARRAA